MFLSVLALFGISLISLGAMVLLAEAAKRQSGARQAVDGVMYFVFYGAIGVILLLGTSIAAGVLFFRRKVQP